MPDDEVILTTKDFTILEVLHDRPGSLPTLLLPLLRHKLQNALVVLRDDLPTDVASINSRVSYRIDGGNIDSRVISTGQINGPEGMFLPITTLRGLALIGLREGQAMSVDNVDGVSEKIVLLKVEYQPEATRRERDTLGRSTADAYRKPLLRLIVDGLDQHRRHDVLNPTKGPDDPGPSAA